MFHLLCEGQIHFHRSDTLVTNILIYKNHMILHNTHIIKNNYISDNIAGSWSSPISIESMEENLLLRKLSPLISMGKLAWVWKGEVI